MRRREIKFNFDLATKITCIESLCNIFFILKDYKENFLNMQVLSKFS